MSKNSRTSVSPDHKKDSTGKTNNSYVFASVCVFVIITNQYKVEHLLFRFRSVVPFAVKYLLFIWFLSSKRILRSQPRKKKDTGGRDISALGKRFPVQGSPVVRKKTRWKFTLNDMLTGNTLRLIPTTRIYVDQFIIRKWVKDSTSFSLEP